MERAHAASLLGVAPDADHAEVRRAFRSLIVTIHPDLGTGDGTEARDLIAAYRVMRTTGDGTRSDPNVPPDADAGIADRPPDAPLRLDADTLMVELPADEAFRLLLDAAHDVGEITYLDRSVPIVEVLCRFVDEPATSLVMTVQGRAAGTEVFCTVESIEARPAPPTEAVVDLMEDAVAARLARPV